MSPEERNIFEAAFNRLAEKVEGLTEAITIHSAEERGHHEKLDSLAKTVWGNGRSGLDVRVDRLEQIIKPDVKPGFDTRVDRLEQSRSRAMWVLTTTIGLICSILGSAAYVVIQKFMK
jgi:hypothetical protein